MSHGGPPSAARAASVAWPGWTEYPLAVLVVLALLLVRWWLNPVLGDRVPFITVFAAMLPLILLVRPGAFLTAALVGLAGVWYLFVPPRFSFALESGSELAMVLVFATSALIAGVAAWLSSKRRRIATQSQELLRRNAEAFYNLVHNSPFGVYVVDSRFCLVEISAGARKVFSGIEPLIGRDFTEILRIIWPEPFASEAIDRFWHTLATGKPYHAPNTTERRHNIDAVESYDWKIERITLPDGQYGVVCHFYDATRLREAEQALRDADRRKDEFLATLAHELRNPLAPIGHAARYLSMMAPGNAEVAGACQIIDRQVAHMSRLIDDLTDVGRIASGKLKLRRAPADLRECLRDAVETCRIALGGKTLNIRAELPAHSLPVEGDAVRLTQVFGNLLHNACKYTPDGGNVDLVAQRDGRDLIICVKDDGIGILPDQLPRVFDMFVQADQSLERAGGGLGIGLSLVKAIVEMHGGSVGARSDGVGKGSEFTVRLPARASVIASPSLPARDEASRELEPPLARSFERPPAGQPAEARPRVLIVDDNLDAARTLAKLLRLSGHDTELAADGPEALRAAEAFAPEIVLLDLGLPRMSGYEVCRAMREQPWGRRALVIATTGLGAQEDRRKTAEAGFDDHLVKPVDYQQLMARLQARAASHRRTSVDRAANVAALSEH